MKEGVLGFSLVVPAAASISLSVEVCPTVEQFSKRVHEPLLTRANRHVAAQQINCVAHNFQGQL
jgi:hypothetical protein